MLTGSVFIPVACCSLLQTVDSGQCEVKKILSINYKTLYVGEKFALFRKALVHIFLSIFGSLGRSLERQLHRRTKKILQSMSYQRHNLQSVRMSIDASLKGLIKLITK